MFCSLHFLLNVYFLNSLKTELPVPVTPPLYHAEEPHWDEVKQVLYYTDVTNGLVNKYDPATGCLYSVYIGGNVGPVLTVQNYPNQFVVGRDRDLITFEWDEVSNSIKNVTILATIDENNPSNIFNDGKADSWGRIWAGSKENDSQSNMASFFSFSVEDNFTPRKQFNATTSNGIAWNYNDTLMYYIDSPTGNIDVFDFEANTGKISNRRVVIDLKYRGVPGVPDGMTIDSDNNLWVAIWGGSRVIHLNPTTGEIIKQYLIPFATQVSSCAFGGKNLDVLYITTSRAGLKAHEQPLAGSVFAIRNTGSTGQRKNNKVKFPLSNVSKMGGYLF